MTQANKKSKLMALSNTWVSRLKMFSQVGLQYGGDRDIYEALGYDRILDYTKFSGRYQRQDIAKAIIDRPVKATWRGGIQLLEAGDDKKTPFEKTWEELDKSLKLHSKFVRLDKLSSIGYYGVLLLGLDDVQSATTDFQKPIATGKRKLLYVKPLAEGSAEVTQWETNPNNERYGQPKIYDVTINTPGTDASTSVRVHYDRVIHVAAELLENETEGVPVLQAVYNRLFDLEKITGASAETFWRDAKSGVLGNVDPEADIPDGFLDTLKDQMDEYEHYLRRFLVGAGLDIKEFGRMLTSVDPGKYVDVQIQMISAATGIPKRVLTGSEKGELASTQDSNAWKELIHDRRIEHAEPNIVRATVDRCIKYKILPEPTTSDYSVLWQDLWAPSEQEKAEVGKTRAEALRAYAGELSTEIVPPDSFKRNFLGLSEEEIALMEEEQKQALQEETDDFNGDEDE
jgi:phage-related protein (TIGR01555 family)